MKTWYQRNLLHTYIYMTVYQHLQLIVDNKINDKLTG